MWLLRFAILVTCFLSGHGQSANLQDPVKPEVVTDLPDPVKPEVGFDLPDPVKPDVGTVLRLVSDLTQQIEELKKFREKDLGTIAAMEAKLDMVSEENHSIKQRIKILESIHGPNGQESSSSQSAQPTEHKRDVRRSLRQLFVPNPNRNASNAMTEYSTGGVATNYTSLVSGKLATNDRSEQETMDPNLHTDTKEETTTRYTLFRPGGSVRVGASKPVAFSVQLSSNKVVPENDYIIKFDRVITDTGNNYRPMTGVFTAPTDGVYVFSWTIGMHIDDHGVIDSRLTKNGAVTDYLNTVVPSHSYYVSSSQTSILELSQGDVVAIRVRYFTLSAEFWAQHTSFKGFLLN